MILKEARKLKGISRGKLAEKARVGEKTIYNIESGACIGRRQTIEMIKNVLDLRLSYEEYYNYMKMLKSGQLKGIIDFESNVINMDEITCQADGLSDQRDLTGEW